MIRRAYKSSKSIQIGSRSAYERDSAGHQAAIGQASTFSHGMPVTKSNNLIVSFSEAVFQSLLQGERSFVRDINAALSNIELRIVICCLYILQYLVHAVRHNIQPWGICLWADQNAVPLGQDIGTCSFTEESNSSSILNSAW